MNVKKPRDAIIAASATTRKRRRICGATYLEYALLLALVGIVGAIGVQKYGKAIRDFFFAMADKTAEVTPSTSNNQ